MGGLLPVADRSRPRSIGGERALEALAARFEETRRRRQQSPETLWPKHGSGERSSIRFSTSALHLLGELGDDLLVAVERVLLRPQREAISSEPDPARERERRGTSSPTLTPTPPKPGMTTLSPALTETGTTTPSRFGAPGPTASTRASGGGCALPAEGRNRPDAVFWVASR
mgnify:CR=1 FL=1